MLSISPEPSVIIAGYVLQHDKPYMVNVLNVNDDYVTVQALEGQPFQHPHYGMTDTIETPKSNFHPLFERIDARPDPLGTVKPDMGNRVTILDMALSAAKPQWHNGETITIFGRQGDPRSIYLKNEGGIVYLRCQGNPRPKAMIFVLDPSQGWRKARNAERDYQEWKQQLQGVR